ncbi:nitroreductase/quinone reductase family protein [Millisia brevis]|uniref:nitroreductase/quinone reductase family protein n=1 Tax=Millisia brevis TaxID=264148 RepID=UPI000A066BB2|nr:nitroreductase/quinone reductase family protein [Millisia brevis]
MASTGSTLMNAFPKAILGSRFHSMMSGKYLLLGFTGRKSGAAYTFPVGYVRDGGATYISTDSKWWRNIANGETATLTIGKDRVTGRSRRLTDTEQAVAALRKLSELGGYAKAAGLPVVDGVVPESALRDALSGDRVVLAIESVG